MFALSITKVNQMYMCHCAVDRLISPERVIIWMTECLLSVYMCAQRQVVETNPRYNGRAHWFLQLGLTRSSGGSSCLPRVVTSKTNLAQVPVFILTFCPSLSATCEAMWPPCLVSTAGFIIVWEETPTLYRNGKPWAKQKDLTGTGEAAAQQSVRGLWCRR